MAAKTAANKTHHTTKALVFMIFNVLPHAKLHTQRLRIYSCTVSLRNKQLRNDILKKNQAVKNPEGIMTIASYLSVRNLACKLTSSLEATRTISGSHVPSLAGLRTFNQYIVNPYGKRRKLTIKLCSFHSYYLHVLMVTRIF